MKTNMKLLLAAAGLSEIFSGFSASSMKAEGTEYKKKWELNVDSIMIVGKYFKSNEDYINVMRVNKKYKQLVLMYKFNPISDISLFKNIQTQHFYNDEDVKNKKDGLLKYIFWNFKNKKDGMYQYIYWTLKDYTKDYLNKKDNEVFKNIELNSKSNDEETREYPLEIKNGNCIVPEGIHKIGSGCFYNCSSLTNITLPSTLKEIGRGALADTKITSIIIPEGVSNIKWDCFKGCTKLTNITLPSTLKEIGSDAFANTKITSITIPEGVTYIGRSCFNKCTGLTNVTLPSTLKEIEYEVFADTKITSIIIPEGVSSIGWGCFEGCTKLTNITLPSTLKEIGSNAFANTKITSIIIPEGVSSIGERCFADCTELTNVTLPSTLKEIGKGAFGYTNISEITVPEGCKYDGKELHEEDHIDIENDKNIVVHLISSQGNDNVTETNSDFQNSHAESKKQNAVVIPNTLPSLNTPLRGNISSFNLPNEGTITTFEGAESLSQSTDSTSDDYD